MSRLSAEEQRLIEQALAEGRVTHCPTGASAFAVEYRWCDKARTLVPVDGNGMNWRGGASFNAHRNARDKRVWERRGKVKQMMLEGVHAKEIAGRLKVPLGTIYDDARRLGRSFRDVAEGVA
jgi:hypothetical protein